jgi:hypothetical protein
LLSPSGGGDWKPVAVEPPFVESAGRSLSARLLSRSDAGGWEPVAVEAALVEGGKLLLLMMYAPATIDPARMTAATTMQMFFAMLPDMVLLLSPTNR